MSLVSLSGVSRVVRIDNTGRRINVPVLILGLNSVWASTKDLDLGFPNLEKYVDRIVFDLKLPSTTQQLLVDVGWRDRLKDDMVWLEGIDITQNNPIVDLQRTAKFFTIKVREDLPIGQWELSRIEFWGEVMEGRL